MSAPRADGSRRAFAAERFLRAAICVGLAALTYCLLLRVSERYGDFSIHTAWAAEMDFAHPRSILRHVVHFLWHLPVAALVRLDVSSAVAASAVTAAWKVAQFLLLRRVLLRADAPRVRPTGATLWALVGVLVMCLRLPGQHPGGYYTWLAESGTPDVFGSPNVWHSPTQIVSMALALAVAPYLCELLTRYDRARRLRGPSAALPWRDLLALAVLLGLSVLGKPTFYQAFLPAAGTYGLWLLWRRYPGGWRFFGQVLLAFLPALLVFAFSYVYYGGMVTGFGSGLAIGFSAQRLARGLRNLLLTSAFPLAALCVCGRGRLKGRHGLWLALLMMAWSLAEYTLLAEQGTRGSDGNMGWALMSASALLWSYTLPLCREWLDALRAERCPRLPDGPAARAFARGWQLARGLRWRRIAALAGASLLTWHLVSGALYLIYFFDAVAAM